VLVWLPLELRGLKRATGGAGLDNDHLRLDGVVDHVGGLHQGEVVHLLGVLVVPEDLEGVLDLDLVVVDGVGLVDGHGFLDGVGLEHGVGLGHEAVVDVLHHLPAGHGLGHRHVVLRGHVLLGAAVLRDQGGEGLNRAAGHGVLAEHGGGEGLRGVVADDAPR